MFAVVVAVDFHDVVSAAAAFDVVEVVAAAGRAGGGGRRVQRGAHGGPLWCAARLPLNRIRVPRAPRKLFGICLFVL